MELEKRFGTGKIGGLLQSRRVAHNIFTMNQTEIHYSEKWIYFVMVTYFALSNCLGTTSKQK